MCQLIFTLPVMDVVLEPVGRMQPYGLAHLLVLFFTLVVGVLAVWAVRRERAVDPQTPVTERALKTLGWLTLAVTVAWTVWGFLPMNFNLNESLPFHFSDAARIITVGALLTRAGWAIAISYYWGLTLNLQSIITPDLNFFLYPELEFIQYWFLHIVVLLAPVVQVWGQGYRPTWRGYGLGYAATVSWAAVAFTVNVVTGANYAYLSHGPAGPSILDYLGPWPIYILWEAVLIAVGWALMTWPWTHLKKPVEMVRPGGFVCQARPPRQVPHHDAFR